MLVIAAPGQGAQSPGFLRPWLEVPGVEDRLHWLSAVSGVDLVHYGTEADAETIRDTAVAQPLLVAAGLVGALSLWPHPSDAFRVIGAATGHSVGEITAAAGVGTITAEAAMVLVRERGRAMATASAVTPTGMSAVVGGDPAEVDDAIARHGLTGANRNGGGQVVAAGTMEQLAALAGDVPAKARVIPLKVAGAFHTEHMAPAVDHLARLARSVSVRDPRARLISNRDGAVVHDGREVLARIVSQVRSPVRWDSCLKTMRDLGVTAFIEVPPAGTLAGIAKRELPGVEVLALKTPDNIDAARSLIERHATTSPLDDSPTWRLLVAPAKGTIRTTDLPAGTAIDPGATIGTLLTGRDQHAVVAPHGGTVVEWLVEDGDPVSPGQPLVRLHPQGALA